MNKLFNIPDNDAQKEANYALSKFLLSPSQEKRKQFQKRMDFYNGVQLEYLKQDLKTVFKYPERLKLQAEYYNLTEFLIREAGAVYNEPPIRKVINGDDIDEEIYALIWEESKIDLVMQEVNRMTKLHKTVLVKVCWRHDQISYDILTPNCFDVIENTQDQTIPDCITYVQIHDKQKDEERINNDRTRLNEDKFENNDAIFHYWTDEKYIAFKRGSTNKKNPMAKVMQNKQNPDNINPYQILPFVVVRDSFPKSGFFIEGGDDVIDTNSIINQKKTEKNYLTKMQSFSVPVRKGAENANDPIILDPSMCVELPGDSDLIRGADFRFITPDSKIEELRKDIESKIREIAIKYKMNPDIFTAGAERSSSQSLQLQNAQQAKIIKSDKPFYIQPEKDLFEISKIVWNTHNDSKISDTCELEIDYRESEVVMTVEDRDNHNITLLNNGMISKADWLMDINPDIRDREQAMERLIQIAEENKLIFDAEVTRKPEIMTNGDDTEEPTAENKEINE